MRRAPTLEDEYQLEADAAGHIVKQIDQDRKKAQRKRRLGRGKVGSRVVTVMAMRILPMLNADLEIAPTRGGGGRGELKKELSTPHRLAACEAAIRAALNRLYEPATLNTVALAIAEAVEDILKWRRWKIVRGKGAKVERRRFDRAVSHQRHRAARGLKLERDELIDSKRKPWGHSTRFDLGGLFVLYLERNGLVERTMVRKGRWPAWTVRLTEKALREWDAVSTRLAEESGRSHPLIVPPKPWIGVSGGGFHFSGDIREFKQLPSGLRPLALIRRDPRQGDAQSQVLDMADLSKVYGGLNALQRTAWRVNPKVLKVLATLKAERRKIPGGNTTAPPIPDYLSEEEASDEEKLAEWRTVKRAAHVEGDAARSRRAAQGRTLATAQRFARYGAIYFAHNIDFRGRVYPCSVDLSPHGNDLQRGLLEFAHGEKLTRRGLFWLKVHLANSWGKGEDKKSFPERCRWVDDNKKLIVEVASKPYACTAWHDADEPWQFLAACFAWKEHRNKPASACRVPVILDGSCSGLQHWAALIGDRMTAEAVNLLPSKEPRDLYGEIAAETVRRLKQSKDKWAAQWCKWGIDRKIVKPAVMVLPYGGTEWSHPKRILEAVRDRIGKDKTAKPFWSNHSEEWKAVKVLANTVWDAMVERIGRPVKGMEGVKAAVEKIKCERGSGPIGWTSPSGLPVITDYRLPEKHSQPVVPASQWTVGKAPTLRHYPLSQNFNWSKAITATAPNFIHSLDASHLLLSMKRAGEQGIANLAAVHDAFATSPSKTDRLRDILRAEFARLYGVEDLLERLPYLVEEIDPEAVQRAFDPAEIERSDYLFS